MGNDTATSQLIDDGVAILRQYLEHPRTELLRDLAPLIVELRSRFHLEDGRPDWGGRSTGYRQAMADLYTRARVPSDQLDKLQTAMRYHVGNLLREKASKDELLSVGMTTTAPKERIHQTREAYQAMKAVAQPARQDIARLTAYSQALLEFIDESAIPALEPERAVATRIGLEHIQARCAELLVRVRDAGFADPEKAETSGRHHKTERAGRPCLV